MDNGQIAIRVAIAIGRKWAVLCNVMKDRDVSAVCEDRVCFAKWIISGTDTCDSNSRRGAPSACLLLIA
jgi:hypothetical protein